MNTEGLTRLLARITAEVLADMRAEGATDPIPWDINTGWCEEWGERVYREVPGANAMWLEEGEDDETYHDYGHYAVEISGLWYDAECLTGVADWHSLPCVASNNPRPV